MSYILTNGPRTREKITPRTRWRGGRSARLLVGRVLLWLAIAVLLIIEVGPLLWLLLSSFKADKEFTLEPLWALPAGLDWQNYINAVTTGNTRRSSSSGSTRKAPGRVDSPPTSTMSTPASSNPMPCSIAWWWSK